MLKNVRPPRSDGYRLVDVAANQNSKHRNKRGVSSKLPAPVARSVEHRISKLDTISTNIVDTAYRYRQFLSRYLSIRTSIDIDISRYFVVSLLPGGWWAAYGPSFFAFLRPPLHHTYKLQSSSYAHLAPTAANHTRLQYEPSDFYQGWPYRRVCCDRRFCLIVQQQ